MRVKHDNIPGYPGYYISPRGILWCRKLRGSTKGTLTSTWYRMKGSINQGRRYYSLWNHCYHKMYKAYRLVAMVYIPNPENKPYVCHKDNNPLNDRVENLYWGTAYENNHQCIREGRSVHPSGKGHPLYNMRGEYHPASKTSDLVRKQAIELVNKGLTQYQVAKELNKSQGWVSRTYNKYNSKFYNRENLR